jgi:outer membrane protein TolC
MMRLVCLILGFCIAGSQGYSQETLTLEQSREMALKYNHLIKMAQEGVQESQSIKKAAFTNFLPKLEGSAEYNHMFDVDDINFPGFFLPTAEDEIQGRLGNYNGTSNVYFPGMNVKLGDIKYHTLSLSVMQPLYMGGKIRSGYRMARLGEAISNDNTILQKSEVLLETDQAYWNLVSVKEKVLLAAQYKEMLKALVEDLENAFQLELTTRNEVLKAKVQLNQAELSLLKAENGNQLAMMALCQVIGKDLNEQVKVADSVVVVENNYQLGNHLHKALAQRPELMMLEKQVRLNGEDENMTNADFMPQLAVGAGYNYTGEINDMVDDQGLLAVQASLRIPVFHWKERKHQVAAAKARRRKSELQLERSRDLISLEVKQSYYKLQEAHKQIEMAQIAMNQAQENVRLTQDSFYEGLATTTELLDAQAFWQQAYSELIDAKINFKTSETSFLKSIGELGNG